MNDLVTVAVAVYNAEMYIGTMIESILNQSYRNLEILLINDGSTDNSEFVCRQYEDERIVVINKVNEGLSSVRQYAIENANGKYLCMVDADDYLDEKYIEMLYRKIDENNADIAVCSYRQYWKYGERVISVGSKLDVVNISQDMLINEYYSLACNYILSDSWNKMYSVHFLRETGVRFIMPKQYNGTDWLFNHLLFLHNPCVVTIRSILYNYQILENSRVRRKDKDLQSGFMIITENLLKEIKKLNIDKNIISQISVMHIDRMRAALNDCYINSDGFFRFADKYRIFRKKFYEFDRQWSMEYNSDMLPKGMKMFLKIMHYQSAIPAYIYLNLRNKRINTVLNSGNRYERKH